MKFLQLTIRVAFPIRKLVSLNGRGSSAVSNEQIAHMSNDLNLPVVDIAPDLGDAGPVVLEVRKALSEFGFMYVRGHGISASVLGRALEASRNFFAQPASFTSRFAYDHTDLDRNFGFHGVQGERLDPSSPADLKESFSMRNALAVTEAERWPSEPFRDAALALYAASLAASYRIMRIMAAGLNLPPEFFTQRHRGQNVTMRYLHYPAGLAVESAAQYGAGAHTDYGSITLLYQDDVGGLEVLGRDACWHAAPAVPDALLVNIGDLMQRWTNDHFVSTLHRVRPIGGHTDRYSIAFFVDPDTNVQVECIESCTSERRPARYSAVSAGEHIYAKNSASQNVRPPGDSAV
jgi:isopenicillin N synthase-like dioxygenase